MACNSLLKLLPLTRISSHKLCRVSLHCSSALSNSWQRRRNSTSEMSDAITSLQDSISSYSWRRRNSTSELSEVIHSLENCVKELNREINCISDDFLRKKLNVAQLLSQLVLNSVGNATSSNSDDCDGLRKIEIDMKSTKPEDISITLRDNELKVQSCQDEKQADGSRYVREHTYHFTLSSGIDPDTVRSSLSTGILTIEAPLPALDSKKIPINIENKEKQNSDSDKWSG